MNLTSRRLKLVIFTLALLGADSLHLVVFLEPADGGDEAIGGETGGFGRDKALAQMTSEEPGHAVLVGELGERKH